MSVIRNIEVSVSAEGLIRASLHGHAFGTLHACPNSRDVRRSISGVQRYGVRLYNYSMGVAKLSAERGF